MVRIAEDSSIRRVLFLTTIVTFVLAGGANAQTIAQPAAQGLPARIQVNLNLTRRVTSDGVEEQRRTAESVRRSLYEMAMNECSIILSTFKGGCRLASLNVNSMAQERGENTYAIVGNANGTYELTSQQ